MSLFVWQGRSDESIVMADIGDTYFQFFDQQGIHLKVILSPQVAYYVGTGLANDL